MVRGTGYQAGAVRLGSPFFISFSVGGRWRPVKRISGAEGDPPDHMSNARAHAKRRSTLTAGGATVQGVRVTRRGRRLLDILKLCVCVCVCARSFGFPFAQTLETFP